MLPCNQGFLASERESPFFNSLALIKNCAPAQLCRQVQMGPKFLIRVRQLTYGASHVAGIQVRKKMMFLGIAIVTLATACFTPALGMQVLVFVFTREVNN